MITKERVDDLQNGYFIIQDTTKFCFGVDAVLLSNFVELNEKETILDIGCGNGIIPLLLYAKKPSKITGIEINIENVNLANRSFELNRLQDDLTIIHGDIKDIKIFLKGKKFDIVVSNPPYINHGSGLLNAISDVAIARHEIFCNFEDIVKGAAYVLNHGGIFYFIHRPSRLVEIISTLKKYNLEPKTLQFVHSYVDTESTMVMIAAKRNAKSSCKVLKPIVMYER